MALEAHNEAREKLAGYVPLQLDTAMAKAIQAQIDKPGFAGTIEQADKGAYASCGENVFGLTDLTKLSDVYLTNLATDTWFEGRRQYNFEQGVANGDDPATVKASNQFVQVVWAASTKVGFGVKDKYVVAWYCKAAEPGSASKSFENVGEVCNTQGFNKCYNDRALGDINRKRKYHSTGPLTLDDRAARALQLEMNRGRFDGVMPPAGDRDPTFADCGQ